MILLFGGVLVDDRVVLLVLGLRSVENLQVVMELKWRCGLVLTYNVV